MSRNPGWTDDAFSHLARRVDKLCKRGHRVEGANAGDAASRGSSCRTCANGVSYAKRHNLFMDDDRVVAHMADYYERHKDFE